MNKFIIRIAVTEIDDKNVYMNDILNIQVSDYNSDLPLMITLAQKIVKWAAKMMEKRNDTR